MTIEAEKLAVAEKHIANIFFNVLRNSWKATFLFAFRSFVE